MTGNSGKRVPDGVSMPAKMLEKQQIESDHLDINHVHVRNPSGKRCLLAIFFYCVCQILILQGRAQLCTGSLGDPVVNISFGSGAGSDTNFSPPAHYTYTPSTCPGDGTYTITTQTSGCFQDHWHTITGDHTGNGAFMLVNASFEPADFFVTTVSGLCPNTTYEFSAWVMNVLKPLPGIKPNITFSIETTGGTVLNSFNTGDIDVTPQPEWKQYGFFFTTSAGNNSVVLRMTNNAPGGGGNDLALDDIQFRPCGPVIRSSILGQSDHIDVCVNEQSPYTFIGEISPGFTDPVFRWQLSRDSGKKWTDIPGADQLQYERKNSTPGQYWYRLSVAENGNAGISACRIASNLLVIHVHPKPGVSAGPDRIILPGGQTTLEGHASGEQVRFAWSPPDHLSSDTVLNPVASPGHDQYYILSALSGFGCSNEDQVLVKWVSGIFVPTAFTPNGDGKNDHWRIPYLDPLLNATVSVYNRFGQLMYRAAGATVDWDGTLNGIPQAPGIYVYLVKFSNGIPDMKGTVMLVR